MEKPCYKCGQPVEEGVPFCLHCSAPQIRVVIAEPPSNASATIDDAAVSPCEIPQTIPGAILSMRWSHAIQPCALAALVATLLMVLGLNPFVAMISVGFLAVVFYRQRRPGTAIKAPAGAKLGALSGLLWFGMASILEALLVLLLHKGPEFRKELIDRIQQAASQTSDPQALAVFDRLKTPDGLVFLMLFGLVFAFFAAIILAGVGGALGGAILGRKDKP
jgi:hypothetical protein